MAPGSIITTLIPNGPSSYDIDSLKPSNATISFEYINCGKQNCYKYFPMGHIAMRTGEINKNLVR
jgi:hypothetical protein